MKNLNEIKVYLFDLDGTLNMGDTPIEGAMETLKMLTEAGKTVCFVTNNSSKSKYDYLKKVRRMGYNAELKQVITSGMAAASYILKHHKGAKTFVLGTETLKKELSECGLEIVETQKEADIMLLAFDTELTYKKLWCATNIVADGKTYIATHPDFVCPSENGNMPDAGALIALVEKTTGRLPEVVVGKPYAPMAEYVFDFCKVKADEVAFVGDRLYTDIKFAINNNMTGILVLSGETDKKMLAESGVKPDFIFDNVNALRSFI